MSMMTARARAADSWVSRTSLGGAGSLSADGREQTLRNHEHAAEHHRRQRRKLSSELEFAQPLLEAGLQRIRAPARLA